LKFATWHVGSQRCYSKCIICQRSFIYLLTDYRAISGTDLAEGYD